MPKISALCRALTYGAALTVGLTVAALAAPVMLTPANPQPSGLKPGLSVRYAYPSDVKSLAAARNALKYKVEQGAPLKGLDYRDTELGQNVLTAKRAERVVADIRGYVRFDAPGIYTIDFLTNDGLHAVVGGQVVGEFDGRQPCEETFAVEVEVPEAGWYPLKALWFQRTNTACLHMRAGPAGKRPKWMPNAAFGH
ncbi:PA14 domain-containing protein [Tritonibacter mobilis]|uniref:PA14 domain-containing protein n=1 Tax=Tritonibacter mobilis TaxID=379347 RepID=UPI00080694DB|nr:PA14 domain-containing protein [Tritonibacter mobilis]